MSREDGVQVRVVGLADGVPVAEFGEALAVDAEVVALCGLVEGRERCLDERKLAAREPRVRLSRGGPLLNFGSGQQTGERVSDDIIESLNKCRSGLVHLQNSKTRSWDQI